MKTDLFIYLLTDGIIDRRQQNDLFHTCGRAMKKKIPPKPHPQLQKNYAIHKISMSSLFFFLSPYADKKSLSVHVSYTYIQSLVKFQ